MLKIHETVRPDGSLAPTLVFVEDGVVHIDAAEGHAFPLPAGALRAVMNRYGRPLDPRERFATVATIDLGAEGVLRHIRHLAKWDVIGRDWLVYELDGREPLCAMATTVAGALLYLGRAATK